ncbi:hypothetical protein CRYUN_Cryun05aG0057000 [Craigia yunnanensis]
MLTVLSSETTVICVENGKNRVLGLMLAVLCVITSEYACNCSELDPEALFDFGSDLNDPENMLSYGSLRGGNSCRRKGIGCNNNGAVVLIDTINSKYSSRNDFWNLIGVICPSLLKHEYLEYLYSSLHTFNELDLVELLHQVLAIFLSCSFMMSL